MRFFDVSDSELFRIFNDDPFEAIELFKIKYESEIKKINTVYQFYSKSAYTEQEFILDIEKLNNKYFNNGTKTDGFETDYIKDDKKKDGNIKDEITGFRYDNSNIVGDYLNAKIDAILEIIYNETFHEIDYEDFKDYFLMVEGKDAVELERMQMERFNYIGRPLVDERDQLYDSLVILEHYLFDVNSNEIVYTPEELGYVYGTINEIRDLISENRIEEAKMKLVALQMIMGLDVRFYPTLRIILDNFLSIRQIINMGVIKGKSIDVDDIRIDDLDNPKKKGPIL